MKIAVIDIGSNSVRIAIFADGTVVLRNKITTRLGEGLYADNLLKPEPVMRTVRALKVLYEKALLSGVDKENFFAFATAAVRNSHNGQVFLDEVKNSVNLPIDVLSGETEAEIALLGALDGKDGAVVDIGGASTELIVCRNGKREYVKSVKTGAVILHDVCGEDRKLCEEYVEKKLSEFDQNLKLDNLVAIGGTSSACAFLQTKLDVFDREKTDGLYISVSDLESITEKLFSLTLQQRIKLLKLEEKRAEIICGGSLILLKLLQRYGLEGVTVSEQDNLEGYYRLLRRKTNGKKVL